jgi:hypothetical protein
MLDDGGIAWTHHVTISWRETLHRDRPRITDNLLVCGMRGRNLEACGRARFGGM